VKIRTIRLADLTDEDRSGLVQRSAVPDPAVRQRAADIVSQVRAGGDQAVQDCNRRFGGGLAREQLRLPPERLASALAELEPEIERALRRAIDNIEACHRPQRPVDQPLEVTPGVRVDRRWTPLQRVGIYVPGGRAAYPSSLLMTVVPAKVAGVPEIVVVTPADDKGDVSQVLMAAAALLGVEEVYVTGGAQAVAALAYGTETIRPVDKIVGPGNAWVTAAKLAVYGDCAVDLPAGPSEALLVADATAEPHILAADLLCQAEHGPDSLVTLVTDAPELIPQVVAEIDRLLPGLEREAILRSALADHGLLVEAESIEEAIAFANEYASEHVTIHTAAALEHGEQLVAAGSVYLGPWAPESAGDYATGANHVLPTGGLARSHGPLAVDDFGSWRQVQHLTREGLESLRQTIGTLATAEGLTAHRLAVEIRFEETP